MPAFKPYPSVKTMPSRKSRKQARNKLFRENKQMTGAYTKRARKEAKNQE
jgi:hypothetical protein